MRASIDRLLARVIDFPVEISLTNGDRHRIPHPELLRFHRITGDLAIFGEDTEFALVVNPEHIVSVRPVRAEF